MYPAWVSIILIQPITSIQTSTYARYNNNYSYMKSSVAISGTVSRWACSLPLIRHTATTLHTHMLTAWNRHAFSSTMIILLVYAATLYVLAFYNSNMLWPNATLSPLPTGTSDCTHSFPREMSSPWMTYHQLTETALITEYSFGQPRRGTHGLSCATIS